MDMASLNAGSKTKIPTSLVKENEKKSKNDLINDKEKPFSPEIGSSTERQENLGDNKDHKGRNGTTEDQGIVNGKKTEVESSKDPDLSSSSMGNYTPGPIAGAKASMDMERSERDEQGPGMEKNEIKLHIMGDVLKKFK